MKIQLATSETDILKCWQAIQALRPHLQQIDYLPTVQQMIGEGYKLAYIEQDERAVSIIGFRYLQYLFNGKHIYIDDLSTLPDSRGKGYAGKLLDYVFNIAREEGYKTVTLDSGHQRFDAHRLYLNKGFVIASHHFVKTLTNDES